MNGHVFWLAVVLPMFFTVVFTVVGAVLIMVAMKQRSLTLEMKHRERMAMIDKGLVPEPGRDPAAFEVWQQRHENPPARGTRVGIVIIALGLSFMLIVGFTGGAGGAAVGIGGAIIVIGVAFMVNGELQRRSQPPPPPSFRPSDPRGPVGP